MITYMPDQAIQTLLMSLLQSNVITSFPLALQPTISAKSIWLVLVAVKMDRFKVSLHWKPEHTCGDVGKVLL